MADTLTDAQADVLRRIRDERPTDWRQDVYVDLLSARGLVGGSTVDGYGLTAAGREALARHDREARDA